MIDYFAGLRIAGELVASLAADGVAISVITFMEILEGVRGGNHPLEGLNALRTFLEGARMYDINPTVAEHAADIRLHLRQQKQSVNHCALDILIAATAIEHNLILVTRNVRDYADIPGLQLNDR
jgi:predicted nucleic acid-binding protein